MKRNLWKLSSAVLIVLLLLGVLGNPASAALDLKVGYYDYDQFFIVDEEGRITGYAGEILDMLLEANTHWKFIPVEFQRGTFVENMRKGLAVLTLQSPYSPDSPRFYTFSEYPIGVERGVFYVLPDREVFYEDFAAFDGMRVGTITGDLQNNLFNDYQSEHGFSVQYMYYDAPEAIRQALFDQDIDGMIYGGMAEQADLKIVARYAETPLHVGANQWGADYIEYFDRILYTLQVENPYYFDELYARYFDDAPRAVQALTEAEYIAETEAKEKAEEEARLAAAAAAAAAAAEREADEARRRAEEEARLAAEEEAGPAEASGDKDGGNKRMTQIGFIVVVALLAVLLAATLWRKKAGNAAKAKKAVKGKTAKTSAIQGDKKTKTKPQGAERKRPAAAEKEEDPAAAEEARRLAAEEAAAEEALRLAAEAEAEAAAEAREKARREAEEEARLKAEAEEEAKRLAQEEARYRAREEARARAREIARHKAEEEARTKSEDTGNIVSLPGWFDAMTDSDREKTEETESPEYTDDQIRGEIYLSGLTISLQPRYSVNHNSIIGAEVSVSSRHPIRDRIYPEELVKSLTQKAKLYILDRYLFESLCMCKLEEKIESYLDFEIVIPVFTESVLRPDFSQWYIDAAKNYNIPPAYFRLDLVYSWQTDQDQLVYQSLQELTAAGFRVALKEVGNTNYPLDLLSEVDLEAVVVAEQLIVDALANERKRKLLMAMKGLCAQMGFRMEADRIDSREKLQLLSKVGCQVFQGNFLTRAIPFEQFWDYKSKLETRIVS